MNSQVIILGIFGGLLSVYGLWLLAEGDYIWGVFLLVIGLLNGVQMIRSIKIEEDRKKYN